MEEAGVPGENHRPWTSNWSTLSLLAASRAHLFCNLQSWARTNAVLVIGLYELLEQMLCIPGYGWISSVSRARVEEGCIINMKNVFHSFFFSTGKSCVSHFCVYNTLLFKMWFKSALYLYFTKWRFDLIWFIVSNATFSNISAI
jgi:hypothetical protein